MDAKRDFVPLSTNALMRHLRVNGVAISGSSDKRKLQNIGYYHGYKGYRFARERRNQLPISSFEQIQSLYSFDMELKTVFYPRIMQIETSLKSRILDVICSRLSEDKRSASYDVVCSTCLTGLGAKEQYRELSFMAGKIAKQSSNNGDPVIKHFTDGSRDVPIWALLETLSLGEFSTIYSCLTPELKELVYEQLGMPPRSNDPTSPKSKREDILLALLWVLARLRNSVAHNDVILDARFTVRNQPSKFAREYLGQSFGIDPVPFSQIADCMLLMVFFMTALGYSKKERKKFVLDYARVLETYSSDRLPDEIFHKVIGRSDVLKIKAALAYVSRN